MKITWVVVLGRCNNDQSDNDENNADDSDNYLSGGFGQIDM